MVLRSIVHSHMRTVGSNRRRGEGLGKSTVYALIFAIFCGTWLTFKKFESDVFPVIKDFSIEGATDLGSRIAIHGTFNKVRDCDLVDIMAYSGNKFVDVEFTANPTTLGYPPTRLTRHQTFGPWILLPKVPKIEIYARHICLTGSVTTKLFNGAIIL